MTTTEESTPKRKGGRPPIPAEDRLSFAYKQSLRASVGATLERLAGENGESVAKYVRRVLRHHLAALGTPDPVADADQARRDAEAQALADKARIAELEAALQPFAEFGAQPQIRGSRASITVAFCENDDADTVRITAGDTKAAASVLGVSCG